MDSGARTIRPVAGCLLLVAAWIGWPGTAGAYQVGHTSITFIDPGREDRPIPSRIYYPAESSGEDVPLAGGASDLFPVVSFGHGYTIPWSDYEFVWEGLAPEGYIVVLPETGGELLPDHLEFARDLAFVITGMEQEGSDPSSLFYEKLTGTSAVMGHSMGGGASILAAAENPSITAVANLAAAETDPSAISAAESVGVPALLFAGSKDCVTPPTDHQIPIYNALPSPCKTYISLTGASHCQFAETNFLCGLGEIGCPSPDLTRQEQHGATLLFLVPWLDYHLAGEVAAWALFLDLLENEPGITWMQECPITDVAGSSGREGTAPAAARLLPNRPNPFNPETTFAFELAQATDASLVLYDLAGRRVRLLLEGGLAAGRHEISWPGTDDRGTTLPSGAYFLHLRAGDQALARKIILAR